MTDTKKLRELAEMATPGPWEVSGTGQQVLKPESPLGNIRICESNSLADWYQGKTSCWNNIAFIAAANPQAIIEVLDMVDRYREALEIIRDNKSADGDGDVAIARKALEGGK